MAKYQDSLSRVGSNRDRTALRQIFTKFLNDDDPTTLKNLTFGAGTTAILISGANTTPISITGAFTTGINIAADGTTGIAITSAFSGVTGISIAGTASGDGLLISGVCADGIHVSGANTASGVHVSGDQVAGFLFDSTAAADAAYRAAVPTGITLGAGLDINCTSTGVVTTGVQLQGTGTITTGILISATTVTTGISITSATTTGISISGAATNGINIARATYTNAAMQIGAFAASQAAGSAVVFSATCTTVLRVYGESIEDLTSAYNFRTILGRNLVSCVADTVINQETYGVTGQVVVKNGSMNHYHAGVLGTFESGTLCHIQTDYGCAAVMGRVGATNTTVESGGLLAGVMAVQNTATWTVTGKAAGFATKKTAAGVAWPIGLYMGVGGVTQAIRIGDFAGSGAPGSAIVISGATDPADTTQRNLVAVYGESVEDLTSGIHANVGRFRHLVVGSSLQVNHETYGLVGQVVGKSASLLHMHAGLMGTLEANTTAVVCNGAYAYSVAAVIARIGGTNLMTATKPVAGFSAIHNGAALASGSSIAYAACAVSTGNWDYLLGADNCDNLLYVATGTAYECAGVKVATQLTGNAYPKMDGIIRFYVGATAYYIPFYAAGNIDNE